MLTKKLSKKDIFISLLIFAVSYAFFLFLWLQMKEGYAKGLTYMVSHFTAFAKDIDFKGVNAQKEKTKAVFQIERGRKALTVGVDLAATSKYTFNAPLTLAIMSALFFFIQSKRGFISKPYPSCCWYI